MPNRYEPTIGNTFTAARVYLSFLGLNVFSVTLWGQPIPHFERYYDLFGWATFTVICLAIVFPANLTIRHSSLLLVLVVMLTRSFWWLFFAHTSYTVGQTILYASGYALTAVACLLVTTFSEIVQKQRVEYDNLRRSLEATSE